MKERLHYIDVAKGLIILMLPLQHFAVATRQTGVNTPFDGLILQNLWIIAIFFMPAFFILSGYCSNFDKDIIDFLKSLLKTIVLPILTFEVCEVAGYYFIFDINLLPDFTHPPYLHFWFLNAIFIAKLLYWMLNKFLRKNELLKLASGGGIMLAGIVLNQYSIGDNILYYQHGFIAVIFIAFGASMKRFDSISNTMMKYSIAIFPLSVLFFRTFFHIPAFTALIGVTWLSSPIFLMVSISGTLFCMQICKMLNECSVLEFYGRNSLVVYALHYIPLLLLIQWCYAIFEPSTLWSFMGYIIAVYTFEYAACALFIYIFNLRPVAYLIGKF